MREWAKDTSIKLTRKLDDLRSYSFDPIEKRAFLEKAIQECVEEAQNVRDLLLMRYHLNRSLKLSSFFTPDESILAVNYVLLPSIKRAIKLYENADLPYLMAHQNLSDDQIEPPPYGYFVKKYIPDYLTVSNFLPSQDGQLAALKLMMAWEFHDLKASLKRKEYAPQLGELSDRFEQIRDITAGTDALNLTLKRLLFTTYESMEVEEDLKVLLASENREKKELNVKKPEPEIGPVMENIENGAVFLTHPDDIRAIKISPNDRYVASFSMNQTTGGQMKLYDLLEKQELETFAPSEWFSTVDFESPNTGFVFGDDFYFIHLQEGNMYLFNLATREKNKFDFTDYIDHWVSSPSGKFIAVTYINSSTVSILHLNSKKIVASFEMKSQQKEKELSELDYYRQSIQFIFQKDDQLLFCASKEKLKVYDLYRGVVVLEDDLNVEEGCIREENFVWDEFGKILYVNSNPREGIVKKYDFSSFKNVGIQSQVMQLSEKPAKVVALGLNGKYIIVKQGTKLSQHRNSGYYNWGDVSYSVVDSQTGAIFGRYGDAPILSPNGKYMVANDQIYDFETGQIIYNLKKHRYRPIGMGGLGFSTTEDGAFIYFLEGDDRIEKYDLMTKVATTLNIENLVNSNRAKEGYVIIETALFSPNRKFFLATHFRNGQSEYNKLHFWRINW